MKNRLKYLTLSFAILLVLYPYLEGSTAGRIVYNVFLSVIFALSIYAISERRQNIVIGLISGISWFVLVWIILLTHNPSLILTSLMHVFWIVFFAFTAFVLLKYILRSQRVSSDVLYGAGSVYMLAGGVWCGIYSLIETLHPGSFYFAPDLNPDGAIGTGDFIYFSFATLTTVGYGDLVPATGQARSFAVLEAIVGVMYLAIIISRLVGLYISQVKKQN